jgi:hypothetical protein
MRSGEMLLLLLPLAAAAAVASEPPITSAVPASRCCCCCLLISACCSRLPAGKLTALMLPLSWPPDLRLLLCLYAAAVRLPAGARFALVGLVLQAAVLLNSVLLALLLTLPLAPASCDAGALGAAAGGVQLYGLPLLLLLLLVALAAAAAMAAASGDVGVPVLLRGLRGQQHMQAASTYSLAVLVIDTTDSYHTIRIMRHAQKRNCRTMRHAQTRNCWIACSCCAWLLCRTC